MRRIATTAALAALVLAAPAVLVLAGDDEGDDHGDREGGTPAFTGRPTDDVGVRLSLGRRKSALPRIRIKVKNRGTRAQSGILVRLTTDSADGLPLWSGTASLPPGGKASFRPSVAMPPDAAWLVATAELDGVVDQRPADNEDREYLGRGSHDPGTSTTASAGAALFAANCASCHGADARGTSLAEGIRGAPAGEILEAVREGEGGMPRFPWLTSTDARNLAAFLENPGAVTPPPSSPPPAPPPGSPVTYDAAVKPILDARCGACHSGKKAAAGIRLDTFAQASSRAAAALAAVQAGRMPPGGPLTASEIQVLADWVAGGTPR